MRRSDNCSRCGNLKQRSATGKGRCYVCERSWARAYYRANLLRRLQQRDSYLKRRYGVSFAELERMLQLQRGCCAICRRPWQSCTPAKTARSGSASFLQHLCVDHNHATLVVRGLLCNACNTALGMFEERPDRFVAALDYLERSGSSGSRPERRALDRDADRVEGDARASGQLGDRRGVPACVRAENVQGTGYAEPLQIRDVEIA